MENKAKVFELNVYNDKNEIIKTCTAVDADIRFGAIRKIMALLDMDDIDNTAALLKTVYGAWDQITKILTLCFPDMDDDDWDNVLIEELIPVVVGIAKASITKILSVPSDSKN